jgi:A/G-specific adenine glycosylase
MSEFEIFESRIIDWYENIKRDLPWRKSKSPYSIWLSEIILQQTRVSQGLPYYERFIEHYPDVVSLANAPIDDVLRLWQGLGYYSRARNLHKCAKVITYDHDGIFPKSSAELLKLPGIGRYTAAAIASMAFDENIPVIDGNVYRVLSRIFDISVDISQSSAYEFFHQLSLEIIPKNSPGRYNQAVMEFGALQCTPKRPNCKQCIVNDICKAFIGSLVQSRPIKSKKVKIRKRKFNYLIFSSEDQLLINQRTENDIWQGLYDFYNIEGDLNEIEIVEEISILLAKVKIDDFNVTTISDIYRHKLTHQHLEIRFFEIRLTFINDLSNLGNYLELICVDKSAANRLGKPIIISNYLNANF